MTLTRASGRSTILRHTLAACLLAWSASAWADDVQDRKLCEAASTRPADGIAACTRLLAPGKARVNVSAVFSMRGAGWAAKGLFDSAIADQTEAIQRDPKNIVAYANRGFAFWRKGELDRAIKDFSEAVTLNGDFTFGYVARATALSDKGEFDLAIRDFDRAIALDAASVDAYKGRGSAHYRKGDVDRAIADFDQVVRLDPRNPDRYNDRAEAFLAKGDVAKALADYDEAIRLKPDYWRGYASRGEAFRVKGDLARSLADHDKAIKLDPKSVDAYNNRGLAHMTKGDLNAAIADFSEALLINPAYGQALSNRGEAYRLKHDLVRSLADHDKAIGIVAKSPLQLCRRGDTLLERGDLDRALGDYSEALRVIPTAICGFTGKGQVAEVKGDLAAARAEYQRAASLAPERDQDPSTARLILAHAQTRLAAVIAAEAKALAAAKETEQKALALARAGDRKIEEPAPIDPGRRVALVIGNSAYLNTEVLPNPRRDAESIAEGLKRVGFQSVSLQKDLSRDKLTAALKEFTRVAAGADWAVIYYAGHGMEVSGKNYLVPIDANLKLDTDVEFEAVALDQVLTSVNSAKKLRLVMLDACRDNPFAKTMARAGRSLRNSSQGLADIEPDGATLVVYAAKAGQLALDGTGRGNSPFVAAFLRNLQTPRVEIRKLFDLVRDDVMETTGQRQQPFTYGSVPGREDFFLVTR